MTGVEAVSNGVNAFKEPKVGQARWTTYDAKFYGVKLAPEIPTTIEERAYIRGPWHQGGHA